MTRPGRNTGSTPAVTSVRRRTDAQRRGESGVVILWIALSAAILLGISGLVTDLGRGMNQQTQQSVFIDQVALSAAQSLDGNADAIDRAIAAGNRIADTGNFGDGDALGVQCYTFLSDIGPGWGQVPLAGDQVLCDTCGGTACTAVHAASARFVEAVADPRTVDYLLEPILNALAGGDGADSVDVGAFALAGHEEAVCQLPKLMFCNPSEDPALGGTGADFNPILGQQILMKAGGGTNQWAPGDWGLILPAANAGCPETGAPAVACLLSKVNPNQECRSATIQVKPGSTTGPVQSAANTMFDTFSNPGFKGSEGDATIAPSPNVTKGMVHDTGQCEEKDLTIATSLPEAQQTVPLPRDPCLLTGTNCAGNPRFGSGDWNDTEYFTRNHGGNNFRASADRPEIAASMVTRYEVYRYEIDNGLIPNKSALDGTAPPGDSSPENGNAMCATPTTVDPIIDGTLVPVLDRRVFLASIVNCVEHDVRGNSNKEIPVEAWGLIFVTEPVTGSGSEKKDIYGELIGEIEAGDESGVFHEYPVLYR